MLPNALAISGGPKGRPLHRLVYALHGHELMGWKSPAGVPASMTMITASRRQGRRREARSEGSPSAKMRTDGQKPHRRPSLRASQHNMTKPDGNRRQGKCGGCASRVHVLIRGDLSAWRPEAVTGAGLGPRPKGLDSPPDPTTADPAARPGAIPPVSGQKSAEAIVRVRAGRGKPRKGRTRRFREEPWGARSR